MADIKTFDGVAFAGCGDTIVVVYQAAARLHRSRWIYDRADEVAAANPNGLIGLMIVLPTADTPDAPTRIENRNRLRKLSGVVRRFVTVPVGDEFRISIVRTIMRTMLWMQGQSKLMPVRDTLDDGVDCLLELATPRTPGRAELQTAIAGLYTALGLGEPVFERERHLQRTMGT